ncbi:MAG TPA: hypothetical protein VH817_13720 [Thermoleophilaceae bacterium]|jgi:hypothetical protein
MIAALVVVASLLPGLPALAGPPTQAPPPQPPQLFAPTSIWNMPVPARAARDSGSARLVASLIAQKNTYRAWINTTSYSTPVYQVPAHQATTRVWVDHPPSANADTLEEQLARVPIPTDAQPSNDSDSRMVVWQPSSDTQWEFWHVSKQTASLQPGWHIGWGAVIHNVSQSSGINPWPFGATASGLALMGGLITLDDVRANDIEHALALGVPRVTRGAAVAPANRSDGRFTGSSTIPEGTRFRLDPKLNLDALGLPRATLAIARAAQRYGMIVRDGSGSVSLYAEDPTPAGSNPYPEWFGGQSPSQLLARFPWSHLQVLPPNRGDGTPVRLAKAPKRHAKRHMKRHTKRHHKRRHHHKRKRHHH